MLYDVVNYNDVIFAADSLESIKNICFTDMLWKIFLSNCRGRKLGLVVIRTLLPAFVQSLKVVKFKS